MQERTEWAAGITFVVLGLAVGLGAIILVRFAGLPEEPWLYVGIGVGIVSALAGALLAFIRADEVSH
ncbi:hypothetical protein [Aeromicrobium sp.]|uniref:hypothetical protein n=1 Tax=Aeromicrobium sp. TaxID=1871063 RepID=UPI003D6C42AC